MKLTEGFNLLATAPDGIKRLRELILSLAVQGKLVPQDPNDEPASELLKQIRAERDRLIAEGKIRKDKPKPVAFDDACYELPENWGWTTIGEISTSMGSGWSPACLAESQNSPDQWAVLKTTAVQLMEYQAWQNKQLPSNLQPRPEIEVQNGDILITRAGPRNRVGISCLVQNTPSKLMISDKIVRFHVLDELVSPQFVVLCLNAGWSCQCLDSAKSGMAESQVNISQGDLKDIPLPLCTFAEQSRIVAKVEELMALCDALETRGQLQAEQHTRLTATLFDALAASESAHQLQENWARLAASFDLVLDRPQAVDALEQTILQLAVRGLLVPQDPADEPASELLKQIRAEKDRLIAEGKIKKDKPLPAISDDEKPFDLPQGWEWVRLGALIELLSGQHLGPSEYKEGLESGIPYLTGPAEFGEFSPFPTRSTKERRAVAIAGDILITVKGSGVGKLNITAHPEIAISRQLMAIRPIGIVSGYLMLVLQTMGAQFQEKSVGIAIPGIGRDDVRLALIGLAPLAEQARIVARVEALRALCGQLRQRLAASRDTQGQLASALLAQG